MATSKIVTFSTALAKWLEQQKFIVGPPAEDIKMDAAAVDEASGWLGTIAKAFGVPLPAKAISVFLTTGAPRDQVEDALVPYLDNAYTVALHVGGSVTVVPVIHADGMPAEEILERFVIFIEQNQGLSNLGMRFILSSTSPASVYVYPLLVYTKSKEAIAAWDLIKEHAWFTHPQVTLRAACINLAAKHIEWAEPTGKYYKKFKTAVDRLDSICHKDFPLNNAVLVKLLGNMKSPAKKKAPRTKR
jgi:hypothetical protein